MTDSLTTWATDHLTVVVTKGPDYTRDDEGWDHAAYTLTVRYDGREMTGVPWRQGMGVDTHPADEPETILNALLSDSDAADEDFEDWCGNYGYDTDSRKAYATWEQCRALAKQLQELLGDDWDEVRELDRDV